MPIEFKGSPKPTLGLELELQLKPTQIARLFCARRSNIVVIGNSACQLNRNGNSL